MASAYRSAYPAGWFRQAARLAAAGVPLGFLSVMCYNSSICIRLLRGEAERRKEVCTCTESSKKNPGVINTWLLSCCSMLLGYFRSGTDFFMNLGY